MATQAVVNNAVGGGHLHEAEATATANKKPLMVVGVDESEHSFYALDWALDHFFVPHAPGNNFPFDLLVVHAKPTAVMVGVVGPGVVDVVQHVDDDLKKIAARVVEKAQEKCRAKCVDNPTVEIWEGDARNVLCEAVEKHHASILVIGSHGYGAVRRAVLGSVSDYCCHHAHSCVMIVKKPKHKH